MRLSVSEIAQSCRADENIFRAGRYFGKEMIDFGSFENIDSFVNFGPVRLAYVSVNGRRKQR